MYRYRAFAFAFTLRAAALACTMAAITFFAVDARAFCREISMQAPAGFDPAVSGCFETVAPSLPHDGGLFELYWKNLCVSYSMQKLASPRNGITLDQAKSV